MPSEVRHLLFRLPEVALAIQAYHRHLGQPLPSGLIVDCAVVGDGVAVPLAVRLAMHPDRGRGAASLITIDGPTLTSALIMFCQHHQIPLPARGKKSLQRVADQICLISTLNQRPVPVSAP
ncbi:MAG: hypothetical protein ACRYGM_19515 [Janthinobacterium lividum]